MPRLAGLVAVHRLALLRTPAELERAAAARSGQPVSAANEARVRAALTAACEVRLAALPPWGSDKKERITLLEAISPGERSDAEERSLTMLRLVSHARALLQQNVELFAAMEQEALAVLGGGHHEL